MGIPWATAAVTLAAAAVISGIVVGPIERAIAPELSPIAAVSSEASRAAAQAPAVIAQPAVRRDRAPHTVASSAVTVDAAAIFGVADARAITKSAPAARGRIARARGKAVAPTLYHPEPEPEIITATLAEIDAEWSTNVIPVGTGPMEEPPAALPQAAYRSPVESQAP